MTTSDAESVALHSRMRGEGRLLHDKWDLYDTRHVVYRPARLMPETLEAGYWHAYESFYRWGSILRGAAIKSSWRGRLRHVAYAGGWKKLEPLWDLVIRAKRVSALLPVLEAVLDEGKATEPVSRARVSNAVEAMIRVRSSP